MAPCEGIAAGAIRVHARPRIPRSSERIHRFDEDARLDPNNDLERASPEGGTLAAGRIDSASAIAHRSGGRGSSFERVDLRVISVGAPWFA